MFTFSIILLLLFGLKIEASGRSRRQPNIFNPENFLHCASGFCLPKVEFMYFYVKAYLFNLFKLHYYQLLRQLPPLTKYALNKATYFCAILYNESHHQL